ncbi:MAG: enoyl-CoA hydratase-related protein [Acidimicrobiales bacterium]
MDDLGWVSRFCSELRYGCDKPIVAGINGVAVGAGLSLALAADIRIMARSARLIAGYPRIGGSPDGGMSYTLSQLVGYERAMRFLLENRTVLGDEAKELGLVGEVTDDDAFADRFAQYCQQLTALSPITGRSTKRVVREATAHRDLEGQLRYDLHHIRRAFASDDGRKARARSWRGAIHSSKDTDMAADALLVSRDGGVLTLTNNDAPINRMTLEYMDAVEETVNAAATDPTVRVLVLTAVGEDNVSVGMDLKQLRSESGARGGFEAVLGQRRRVLATIENMGKPSIATLFGYCLGGGLELPLACHFRLAAETDAKIGLPELDLGPTSTPTSTPGWPTSAAVRRRRSGRPSSRLSTPSTCP